MKRSSILTSVVCLLTAVTTTGCGDPVADFVGVYATSGGGEIRLYDSYGYTYRFDTEFNDNINVLEGTSSDLSLRLDGDCAVPLNVDESGAAYVVVGASCSFQYSGASEKWTFQSGSARRSGDGRLDVILEGDVVYSEGGRSISGDFDFDLQLTRVAN